MLPVVGGAHMGGDTLPDMEDFNRAGGDARPQLFLQQLIGHRVIMLVDRDVVIEPGAALLPFRVDIGCHRQRLQGRLVQLREQLPAAGPEMARDLVVELVEQRADGRVHLCEAEELTIAQSGQDPTLNQQNRALDLCFILGFVRPRGHHGCVVMRGHVRIGPVDSRVIKAGLRDPGLQVVGHDLRRHPSEEAKGTHMARDPIWQGLRPRRLRKCMA